MGATLVEAEPRIGGYLRHYELDPRCLGRVVLDGPHELRRAPFFHADAPPFWPGPCGQYMTSAGFTTYTSEPIIAYGFAETRLVNHEAIVLLGDEAVRETLDVVDDWRAESMVAERRDTEYVRLRRPVPVTQYLARDPHLIGFSGAWRNYGHWLLQCLPKLHAYGLMRRRLPKLRLAMPTLAPGSAQQRTLELLGIAPQDVTMLPAGEATGFAAAFLVTTPDIWNIVPLVLAAAERLVAAVGPPGPRPERIYLHRAEGTRTIGNFAAVRALVERFGFAVRSFETTDLAEQIATMQAARFVITEHGAGSANLVFCRPGARVLELFNPYAVEPCFWSLASLRGLPYGFVVGDCGAAAGGKPSDGNSPYEIPPDRLEAAIPVLLGAPGSAPPGPARAEPPPRVGGLVEPDFADTTDVSRLGQSGRHEKLLLFPPLTSAPAQPIVNEADIPPELLAEYRHPPVALDGHVYAIAGAAVWGNGLVTLDRRFVDAKDCFPGYFRALMREEPHRLDPLHCGALGRAEVQTLTVDRPVAVTLHPNMTYGYFLLDMLPRLYVATLLRGLGAAFQIALPEPLPAWAAAFVELLGLREGLLRYDADRIRLAATAVIWPALLHRSDQLHPAMNLLAEAIRARALARHPAPPNAPRRLLLTGALAGEGRLDNLAELAGEMAELGFTAVAPEQFGAAQRIALIAGAEAVAGEYGGTLLEAMFAPAGARIVALGCSDQYLGLVARLRGQRLALVPPQDGRFRHWRLPPAASPRFRIDPAKLREVVQRALAAPG